MRDGKKRKREGGGWVEEGKEEEKWNAGLDNPADRFGILLDDELERELSRRSRHESAALPEIIPPRAMNERRGA
jgi:hypothetical protein